MNWYQNLYVSETLKEKKDQIISRVEKKDSVAGLYLIVLRTQQERNQLEILSSKELNRHTPWLGSFLVVGIAHRKKEANELLVQILDEVYRETGSADMRAYLMNKSTQANKDR